MLTNEDLTIYQERYQKIFKESLGIDEAREQLNSLLHLLQLVYQPITKEEAERYATKFVDTSLVAINNEA